MNSFSRKYILTGFLLLLLSCMIGCHLKPSANVVLDVAAQPFEKLSQYNFFSGAMNELQPNARVVPYDLITPLFTDYAHKARFIYMPDGKTVKYDTTQVLQFPVGSCLIKNFYYPEDFRQPQGKRRIIETRLLVHRSTGWEALGYIWNSEQTDATLENSGDIKEVSWTHYDGTKRTIEYLVPNKNQCKSCHWNNGVNIVPIGPKVRNLNRNYTYVGGEENQLIHLQKAGFLIGFTQPEVAPHIANYLDSTHYNIDTRARAYLEANCGHCHNPQGPAYTSGLYLNIENANIENMGVCKTPVAAGKAAGDFFFDIVPGKPEESILTFRMRSNDPGIRMPEVGRNTLHVEGTELIERWIKEMKPVNCR